MVSGYGIGKRDLSPEQEAEYLAALAADSDGEPVELHRTVDLPLSDKAVYVILVIIVPFVLIAITSILASLVPGSSTAFPAGALSVRWLRARLSAS